MSYLSYEQVAVSNVVLTAAALTIPAAATHVELQASGNNIGYTMDGATDPTDGANGSGMILLTTAEPKLFLVEDLRNIRFVRHAAGDGNLNVHYYAG